MDKIIHLEPYFPQTGELTVQPAVISYKGKNYVEGISKHASVGQDYFKSVVPVPGHSFVYVLAVSAWEIYGENRNGDGFPEFPYKENSNPPGITAEDVLPLHYKTFEEYGYNYRHHCFPAGTPVIMADRTRRAIEEINEGDLVETLEGAKKVIKIMKKSYSGNGVQLSLRGNYEPLTGTEDHPVQVYRRDQVHCPHRYNYLTINGKGCCVKTCQEKRGSIGDPEWAPLNSILPGDYLVFPKPKHGDVRVDLAFARLVGWVASEGHLGKRGIIQFTFSDENLSDISSVKECLEENKLHAGLCPRPQYGLTAVSSCSQETHRQLSEYVSGVLNEKQLTGKILEWDEESLLQMLGAYIDGDGHVCSSGKNAGQLRIRSSSPMMLRVLSDVIKSLGIPATVQWDMPAGTMISPTNGKEYDHSGSGVIAVESAYSPYIARYSRKQFVRNGRNPQVITVGDVFLVQVTERDDIFLDEDVFNLEIEDVHHYIANEVVVHNCNKDPNKAVGRVVKAFWNPPMHRVELLVDIENSKAPDLIERIVAGEFPPVSMGTRVPYDVCSICLNHAPTRAQYCDHLKFNMRQVVNGIIAAALNPKCKFFDISWVFKPADTMAYMMKKVADTHSYELSGAAAGEYLEAMQQRKEAAHKLAVIDKVIQGIPVAAKGEEIDPTELGNLQQMRDTVLDMGSGMQDLPDSALQNLATHPLQKIFSTLFASGMQLSTPEVIKITIYKGYPASEIPGEFVDKSVVMQQKILELLAECPQIMEMFEKNDVFNMSPKNIDPKIAEIAMPFMEKRSGIYEYLHRKVVPEQWREEAPYTTPLSLTDPATGQQYATTRGAAIRAHDEIAKRNLYKVLGGAALLGGAYKVMGSGLTRAGMGGIKPLLGLTLGGVGLAHLPSMGPHYMTDQGIPIPTLTEMAPKQASLALPLFGTLGAMALMGHDYKSRLMQGVPIGHPALPLSRRLLDQLEGTVSRHPLISAGVGTALLHKGINAPFSRAVKNKILNPAYSAVVEPIAKPIRGSGNRLRDALRRFVGEEKLSTYLGDLISPPAGTVALAALDFDKIAEMIGEVIVEG